ncbi:hypothetical protein NP493_428g00016 [Ridgeia piscesae]|uniref:Uncharacterized protein n=1 Tax=Ridgeia piscesae TaxID=27915 RepID=A0AAD9NU48_RIDPI|nr:hypothetical protein NP493_428g00016 [Ridgeia piscesae]
MFSMLRIKSKSTATVYNEADQTVLRLPALSAVQMATVASCDDLVFAGRQALLRATTYPGHPDYPMRHRATAPPRHRATAPPRHRATAPPRHPATASPRHRATAPPPYHKKPRKVHVIK